MSLETLRPNAIGTYTQLTPTGAANNYDCVDEETSDGDTTYVVEDTNIALKDTYNLPATAIPDGSTITQIQVFWRARATTTSGTRASGATYIISGVTETEGTNATLSTSYTLRSSTYTTDPNTGSAWTIAGINALEIGTRLTGGTYLGIPYGARNTQSYIEITYTTPSVIHNLSLLGVGG